jgi:hypothetical protein
MSITARKRNARPFAGVRAAQAVAGEIDAVGVVDDAIEDGIGVGRIADQIMPFAPN